MTFFNDTRMMCKGMLIVISVGLIARAALGYLLEFNNDVTAWTMTIGNFEAGAGLYEMAGYYYPPVWGYILGVFSEFLALTGVDAWGDIFPQLLFTEDWEDATLSTPAFNMALTVMLTVSDLIVSFLIYWLIKRQTGDIVKAKIGFALFFIGINVVFVCGCWGQFDSISALMALLCVCLLLSKKDVLAGMMFTLATLLKLFPGFLIFILVAYIFVKREDWRAGVLKAGIGATLMLVVLMVPSIMDGTVMDSIAFLTARAEGANEGIAAATLKYSSLLIYPLILILEILIAYRFVKHRDDEDIDSRFIWYVFLTALVLFIYPSTPQYLILLMPFVIVVAVVYENRLVRPTLLLMAGSTIFMLPSLPMLLGTVTFYDGLMSFDQWMSLYDMFYSGPVGLTYVIAGIGAAIQYAAWLWMGVIALDHMGIDLKKRILGRMHSEAGTD